MSSDFYGFLFESMNTTKKEMQGAFAVLSTDNVNWRTEVNQVMHVLSLSLVQGKMPFKTYNSWTKKKFIPFTKNDVPLPDQKRKKGSHVRKESLFVWKFYKKVNRGQNRYTTSKTLVIEKSVPMKAKGEVSK